MQIMGGLVGALTVKPAANQDGLSTTSTDAETPFNHNLPDSLTTANSFLLVITYVVFTQETFNGVVSQGCSIDFACDPDSQAPLCYGTRALLVISFYYLLNIHIIFITISGNETTSPYNPFRQYTMEEISSATLSTMDLNVRYNDSLADPTRPNPDTRNYHLVNGQYQPSIVVRENEPFVLRIVHASGGKPLPLELSDSAACNLSIIAWDGVYLDANLYEEEVNMVAASRADVQILCSASGIYSLNTADEAIMHILVNTTDPVDSTPDYSYISDSDLQGINRPYYLQDLTGDDGATITVDSTYTVTIGQDNSNNSVCGYWIGAGTDCSTAEDSAYCSYHQFGGQKGDDTTPYLNDQKLVTYAGAVNEWEFYGTGSSFHPLHVHVNHFQVLSFDDASKENAQRYMRR